MNDNAVLQGIYTVSLFVAAAFGWYSTVRAFRRYRRIAPELPGSLDLIQFAFVIVRLVASIAATWFGYLALRRLLDFEPLDWSPVVSLALAVGVFLLPPFLDLIDKRIAEDIALDEHHE